MYTLPQRIMMVLKAIPDNLKAFLIAMGTGFKSMGQGIKKFFSDFVVSLKEGDLFVRLSLLCMGAGYFKRKQIIKGLIMTFFEFGGIFAIIGYGFPYLSKFSTLGTVERKVEFNLDTMKNEVNNYDHSFKILLFGIICVIAILAFLAIYIHNITAVYKLQIAAESGQHIPSFKEEVAALMNERFHVTILFLPIAGIVCFTIVPLIVMICVAFTNYDQNHLPPTSLFSWVGFENFKALFADSVTLSFGYSFGKVLSWTLIWAFFATITTYIGGILLAMFINNKKTKCQKLWRGLFITAIAVPQFVSLLLVRNFFANSGIVNTICSNVGLTSFLQTHHLIGTSYIPFLTDPNWAKVMIILINIWIGVPYLMLIVTGVLMNIPGDLYESASIDGASSFQMFKKITMPYMLFVTGPYLITSFVNNINNFNVIYLLTQDVFTTQNQQLANSSAKEVDLLVTWLYRLTQEKYNYKMASVIGIMVFVICAIFTLLAFNYTIKGDKEDTFQS